MPHCDTSQAALKAQSLLWLHIIQPLRVSTHLKTLQNQSITEFNYYAVRLIEIAKEMERDPHFLLQKTYVAFKNREDAFYACIKNYRSRNSAAVTKAFEPFKREDAEMEALVIRYLKVCSMWCHFQPARAHALPHILVTRTPVFRTVPSFIRKS